MKIKILSIIFFISFTVNPSLLMAFTDVNEFHSNLDAINYAKQKNIVGGYEDGSFKPENPINRAEFIKIIMQSLYGNELNLYGNCSSKYYLEKEDCNDNEACDFKAKENYSSCLSEDGNCQSQYDIKFNQCEVNDELCLDQSLDDLQECKSEIEQKANTFLECFSDVPQNSWFFNYVCLAKVKKIIQGYEDGSYRPANLINFVEASKILKKAFSAEGEISSSIWYKPYVDYLEQKKAIPTSIKSFNHLISRAEMTEMVYRIKEGIQDKLSLTYSYLDQGQNINFPIPIQFINNFSNNLDFSSNYFFKNISFSPKAISYSLPIDRSLIVNFDDVAGSLSLTSEEEDKILKNGFVLKKNTAPVSLVESYDYLREENIPLFINSDSVLQLIHLLIGENLSHIEESYFIKDLSEIAESLFNLSVANYEHAEGELRESYKRVAAYSVVAMKLLDENFNDVPEYLQEGLDSEINLINGANEIKKSNILPINIDYKVFSIPDHYQKNDDLKKYYKALKWMSLNIINSEDCDLCFISPLDEKIQTIVSFIITGHLYSDSNLYQKYSRIKKFYAYYLGEEVFLDSDNVAESLLENDNQIINPILDLMDDSVLHQFLINIEEQIGCRDESGSILHCSLKKDSFSVLNSHQSPIANINKKFKSPQIGAKWANNLSITASDIYRQFSLSLDLLNVLGSDKAANILNEFKESHYDDYDNSVLQIKNTLSSYSEKDWNKNLFYSWIYFLKPLLEPNGYGFPSHMQQVSWQDRNLNMSISSLMHLQNIIDGSYKSNEAFSIEREKMINPVKGIVEPNIEFYNRLISFINMYQKTLRQAGLLSNEFDKSLEKLENILGSMINISITHLNGQQLSSLDNDFIKDFNNKVIEILGPLKDVNSSNQIIIKQKGTLDESILYKGLSTNNFIVQVFRHSDGRIMLSAGPALHHYEIITDQELETVEQIAELMSSSTISNWMKSISP